MIGSLSILGVLAGYIIALLIPDETQWYPKQFLIAASVSVIISAFFFSTVFFITGVWVGLLFSGAFILSVQKKSVLLSALTASLLGFSTEVTGIFWLSLALLFSAGYFVHHKKPLWWFLLTPSIIISTSFLF